MNESAETAGYRCEAFAEGLECGLDETARYVLGTFRTVSPVLALRWLGGQALWIVDRLGPDPQRLVWVRPFMCSSADPALSHSGDLRAWYEDRESQRAARAHIKTGAPLLVVVPDVDCTYTLSVRPAHG
ncbi:hypothetical protein [Streptomyces sp. NBC_01435]|uniref:hypothetical protein n=1 Tax=Streptomyces sp. NBC_01435 TaxID=2903865 RepID=UPI002E31F430|nr:hypothetical protein [Streptomyces sp. NBC_01435]